MNPRECQKVSWINKKNLLTFGTTAGGFWHFAKFFVNVLRLNVHKITCFGASCLDKMYLRPV